MWKNWRNKTIERDEEREEKLPKLENDEAESKNDAKITKSIELSVFDQTWQLCLQGFCFHG
jgi:hypothetical protein